AFVLALVTAGSALAVPGDPKHHFTRADQALARAALVRKADLKGAGWAGTPVGFGLPNPPCLVQHHSFPDLTIGGEAGIDYSLGSTTIETSDAVFVSRSQTRTAWARETAPGFFLCIAQGVVATTPGLKIVSVTRRTFPRLRDASYSIRIR